VALALAVSSPRIVRSKYGKVLIAVRDAESRTRFLGYRVEHVKLFGLRRLRLHGGRRRSALRAAGRASSIERVRAGQFHRGW